MSIRTRNEKKAGDIAEALRQDNISLQTSGRIMAENLEVLRGKLTEINQIAFEAMEAVKDADICDDFSRIVALSASIDAAEA